MRRGEATRLTSEDIVERGRASSDHNKVRPPSVAGINNKTISIERESCSSISLDTHNSLAVVKPIGTSLAAEVIVIIRVAITQSRRSNSPRRVLVVLTMLQDLVCRSLRDSLDSL